VNRLCRDEEQQQNGKTLSFPPIPALTKMQLRRLLGLSGHLRRSLCSAATPPRDSGRWHGWSWYMLGKMMAGVWSHYITV
jgi:hypothetical protein